MRELNSMEIMNISGGFKDEHPVVAYGLQQGFLWGLAGAALNMIVKNQGLIVGAGKDSWKAYSLALGKTALEGFGIAASCGVAYAAGKLGAHAADIF